MNFEFEKKDTIYIKLTINFHKIFNYPETDESQRNSINW